jgi:hypothetical protein
MRGEMVKERENRAGRNSKQAFSRTVVAREARGGRRQGSAAKQQPPTAAELSSPLSRRRLVSSPSSSTTAPDSRDQTNPRRSCLLPRPPEPSAEAAIRQAAEGPRSALNRDQSGPLPSSAGNFALALLQWIVVPRTEP